MNQIKQFFEENLIPFRDKGKNVIKGWINVRCPICGDDDEGYHCNVNPRNGSFFCWRNKDLHKGGFKRLSNLLIGRVVDIGLYETYQEPALKQHKEGVTHLNFPEYFLEIVNDFPTIPFYNYMKSRGFRGIPYNFNLKADIKEDRIIFPIYYYGKLVSWVGRSITNSKLPYKELKSKECVIPPRECIGNFDSIREGGKTLFLVEGFFDLLKFDCYFEERDNIKVGCLFTMRLKGPGQLNSLFKIRNKFENIGILLDKKFEFEAMQLQESLQILKKPIKIVETGKDFDDPGNLDTKGFSQIVEKNIELF